MSVGAHDRDELPPGDRLGQRVQMLGQIWAGIDDGDLAFAEQIALRPVVSERAGIVREQARDSGLYLLEPGIGRVHGTASRTSGAGLASS